MRELNARTDIAGACWSVEGLRDLITVQLARMTDHPAWTTLRQSLRPPNAIAFNAIAFNAIAFNITTAEFPAGLRRIRHRRLLPPDRGPAAVAQLRTDPGRDGHHGRTHARGGSIGRQHASGLGRRQPGPLCRPGCLAGRDRRLSGQAGSVAGADPSWPRPSSWWYGLLRVVRLPR
jgi:hypothetical protein